MNFVDKLITSFPNLKNLQVDIEAATELIIKSFNSGNKLLLCGNGGSAADCEHISGELMKGFLLKRNLNDQDKSNFSINEVADNLQYGLPCIPLTSFSSLITAVSNDNDASMIFAQGVYALGHAGDILVALSTSGNSKNIIFAADAAKAKGMTVIAITGEKSSKLSGISDVTLKMPSTETYRIQEYTLSVYHAICAEIEQYFYL